MSEPPRTPSGQLPILHLTTEREGFAERTAQTFSRLLDERIGALRDELMEEIRNAFAMAVDAAAAAAVAGGRSIHAETLAKDAVVRVEAIEKGAAVQKPPAGLARISGVFSRRAAAGKS